MNETFTLVIRRFVHFQNSFRARVLEWQLAIVMLLSGWVLYLPAETFTLAPYSFLVTLAKEETWAVILMVCGAVRLLVLAVNGSLRRGSPHIRAILAIISGSLWLQIWVGVASAGFPSLLLAFVPVAALSEIVNILRASTDAKREDLVRGGNGDV